MTKSDSNDSEAIKATIRNSGLRATPARVSTLQLLYRANSPLSHADVAAHLEKQGVDKATAFRNLNDMVGSGILRRTELGDHVWRFEPVGRSDNGTSHHPHFVCVDCGSVSCLDSVKLTAGSLRISQKYGEVTEILLRGHCHECN